MIDFEPEFLDLGTPSGFVAPPQATVVSRRAKFGDAGDFRFADLERRPGAREANATSISQ